MMGWITEKAAARLFGVTPAYLNAAKPYLADFPAFNRSKGYQRDQILAWAEGRDVAQLLKAAVAEKRRQEATAPDPHAAFNQRCCLFVMGAFDSAEQREQLAFKRMVARVPLKNTRRTVVNINPDWDSDRSIGRDVPLLKIITRTL